MFKWLKKLFEKQEDDYSDIQKEHKRKFIEYLDEHKNDNPTLEAMYIIFNKQDIELAQLIRDNNLEVMYDHILDDGYFEVFVQDENTILEQVYVTVGIESNLPFINTQRVEEPIEINANMTAKEIVDFVIKEVKLQLKASK